MLFYLFFVVLFAGAVGCVGGGMGKLQPGFGGRGERVQRPLAAEVLVLSVIVFLFIHL